MTDFAELGQRLSRALRLSAPPIAIGFSSSPPEGVAPFGGEKPAPTEDGRTGTVPAGCAFWMKATDRTFFTTKEDHANCSVGSYTHGFLSLQEAATHSDVASLLDSGWVSEEMMGQVPHVGEEPGAITYGPLGEAPAVPDVVLLRVNARQLMVISDAFPELDLGGKPQCHIIALAKQGKIAASVGCQLSRVRTGMSASEMTCAIPGSLLQEAVDRLEKTAGVDDAVATYAAEDARRFR